MTEKIAESSSKDTSKFDESMDKGEDDEMEFPIDLSEWTILDDDGSGDDTSEIENVQDSTYPSDATRKNSDKKSDGTSETSSKKQTDVKKGQAQSTKTTAAVVRKSSTAITSTQEPVKKDAIQDIKTQSKPKPASQLPAKSGNVQSKTSSVSKSSPVVKQDSPAVQTTKGNSGKADTINALLVDCPKENKKIVKGSNSLNKAKATTKAAETDFNKKITGGANQNSSSLSALPAKAVQQAGKDCFVKTTDSNSKTSSATSSKPTNTCKDASMSERKNQTPKPDSTKFKSPSSSSAKVTPYSKDVSGKSSGSTNQSSKGSIQKSLSTSAKPIPGTVTRRQAKNVVSEKTGDSSKQPSKSSGLDSSVSIAKLAKQSATSLKDVASINSLEVVMSQPTHIFGGTKTGSANAKLSVSIAKSGQSAPLSLSQTSASNKKVLQTKTSVSVVSSKESSSSSTTGIVSKPKETSPDAKKANQKETSGKSSLSTSFGSTSHQKGNSAKISTSTSSGSTSYQKENPAKSSQSTNSGKNGHNAIKVTETTSSDGKSTDLNLHKRKSPLREGKTSELFCGIAEAMEEGMFESEDFPVSDLDSEIFEGKKSKPVNNIASVPKKRPSQHDLEDSASKKAKYEVKNTATCLQGVKSPSSNQPDHVKPSKADGGDSSVNTQNTKRIVRRFHRTTQTVTMTKNTNNKLSQCSFEPSPSQPSTSSKKHVMCNSVGIQCRIGWKFDDVAKLVDSNLVPVSKAIKQDVFLAALAFDVSTLHPVMTKTGVFKYGIRLGHVTQADLNKTLLKDNFIKKADRYTFSFLEKDIGIFDLFFNDEENFASVFYQIRKLPIGPRNLCVTVVKTLDEEEKASTSSWDYIKATLIFDQNFDSTGFFSYIKTPIWNRPKVEEFITMHNVPGDIPLSFLSLIFPDAITVLNRDVKLKFTKKGSGVRLGMNRKKGGDNFLKLFTQVIINSTPVYMTQGLTERRDVPELRDSSNVMAKLDKLEKERQKAKFYVRILPTTPRNINDERKGAGRGAIDDSFRKGMIQTQQDAGSDLSDISELSFNGSYFGNAKEESRPEKRIQRRPHKKIEPRKSLNLTMGSKLLSRARSNMQQTQSKRLHQEKTMDNRRRRSPVKREPNKHIDRRNEDSSYRRGTLSERSRSMTDGEPRSRDAPDSRHGNDLRDRSRSRHSREEPFNDRVLHSREERFDNRISGDPTLRRGQWNQRDSDYSRPGEEKTSPEGLSRNRSSIKSSERDSLNRRSPVRAQRIRMRHEREERFRPREDDNYNEKFDYNHQEPRANSFDRRPNSEKKDQIAVDIKTDDLRTILDSIKTQTMSSPRRHGSAERRIVDSNPGSWRRPDERRKRPLSKSPSQSDRKVIIGRRSFSPRNKAKRERIDDFSHPPFNSSQWSSSGKVSMTGVKGTFYRQDTDSRNVTQSSHADNQEETVKGDNMTISKSLFVKLLSNAFNGDEEGANKSQVAVPGDKGDFPATTTISHRQAQQDDVKGRGEEKQFINMDNFDKYMPHNHNRHHFEMEKTNYSPSGSKKDNYEIGSMARSDDKPIPPPIIPPMFSSPNINFPAKNFDSKGATGPSGPSMSQSMWSVPPPSSFPGHMGSSNIQRPHSMPERFPMSPHTTHNNNPPQSHQMHPTSHGNNPPQSHQMHPPLNGPSSMMFSRPPLNTPPHSSFGPPHGPPPHGPVPKMCPGVPSPMTGVWPSPHSGPYQ